MATHDAGISVKGSCLCGKHEVSVAASPSQCKVSMCHCTDCKKWTGSMFIVNFVLPESTTTVSGGEPGTYVCKGDSGAVLTRAFCRTCGSSLWAKAEHAPGMIMPSGGLFPPDAVPTPTLELYTQSTASWEARLDTAKQFETMPK